MKLPKYTILDTQAQLASFDAFLEKEKPEFIACDTETSGLKFWRDLVVGVSLALNRGSGYYLPLLNWEPDLSSRKIKKIDKVATEVFEHGHFRCVWTGEIYPENVKVGEYKYPDFVIKYLKKWLLDSGVQIIMHNAPFDVLMIEASLGINLQDQVFCDTVLLKHLLDENSSNGLKETAILWSKELGIPADELANKEQIEMGRSVIRNGGDYKKTSKHVWRADPETMGKYAASDAYLTMGIFEVGMDKLIAEYEPKHLDWFYNDEVMPLCREVVIPMRRHGVRIDVPYFEEMEKETAEKMRELEDHIIKAIAPHIQDFDIGASIDDVATKKTIVEHIILKEGLEYPAQTNKKTGETKKTLAKKPVQQAYAETGHWLWGYLLGQAEMEYSEAELKALKQSIYEAKTAKPAKGDKPPKAGKRYQFNIGSDGHLRWLFCGKLGYDAKSLPQTDSATPTKVIPSMKAEVLKDHFLKHHDFVKPLLLYKKLQKLHSTYIQPALMLHNNGFLHLDMVQSGTISGRFACRGGFNLQTLPRVEELDRCLKCGSKDVIVVNPIKLVAVQACNECGHLAEDVVCPSAIKQGFISPEGCEIVNADYSSLEPRCFAYQSGEDKIKEVYSKNLDFYSKVFCDTLDKAGKYSPDPKAPNYLKKEANHLRNLIKPVCLGIPYGARGPQVAKMMDFKKIDKRTGKERLDVERGKEFRELYLDTYPNLRRYMDTQTSASCTKGYVETIVGRRRHFKFTVPVYNLLASAGITIEEFLDAPKKVLETQQIDDAHLTFDAFKVLGKLCGFHLRDDKGIPRTWAFVRAMFKNELNGSFNTPIQGLAAHITNKAMLDTNRSLKEKGVEGRVCLTVHDEVTLYARKDHAEAAAAILRDCMEKNQYTRLIDVEMIAEPVICSNLKESK